MSEKILNCGIGRKAVVLSNTVLILYCGVAGEIVLHYVNQILEFLNYCGKGWCNFASKSSTHFATY